jgi:UDP-3-O-[3-hydroxymyristoyl] glucosamine N-acyltransferase
VVEYSMVCDGVVIKEGAVVPRGCMLSYNTVLGKGVALPPFSRIHNNPPQPPKVR